MSWIGMDDFIRVFVWLIDYFGDGLYNFVIFDLIINLELICVLGSVL